MKTAKRRKREKKKSVLNKDEKKMRLEHKRKNLLFSLFLKYNSFFGVNKTPPEKTNEKKKTMRKNNERRDEKEPDFSTKNSKNEK